MSLLLSEILPLRTTKALGDYAEDVPLPWIFGDLTEAPFPLIRLSPTRYFAADHPMPITRVFVARQVVSSWERVLPSDEDGHTWTEVHFAAPVPVDAEVAACGTGKTDDDTDELIENPGDVAQLISSIAARDDDWSTLRADCSSINLTIAGRIFDLQSVKAQLDRIMQSSVTIWAYGMARLYPAPAMPVTGGELLNEDGDPLLAEDGNPLLIDAGPILDLDYREVTGLRVSASLTDTADVLRVSYDWSDASQRALHYIELSASPKLYGGLSKEVSYPLLRKPQNAETIGRAVLQRLAGQRYDVSFTTDNMTLRPGDWVRPVAHPEWPLPGDDPVIMVLTAEMDLDSKTILVEGETLFGRATVTVTGHSIALPDTVDSAIDVVVRNGIATFTLTDEDGRALAGAAVSLDGSAPLRTNAQGKVSFPAVAGVHELAVEAVGFVPFTVLVTL